MSNKPKFDPNKPFSIPESDSKFGNKKPKFDPEAAFEVPEESTSPKTSAGEAGLRGAAQGASLGFADEFTAGVGAALDYLQQSGKLDYKDYYKIRRDLIREADKKAEKEQPTAFLAGDLAGGVASSFLPGAGALNVGKGAKLATAAGKSAVQSGISELGRTDKEDLEGQVKDVAKGAIAGGALGGAIHSVVPISKALGLKLGKVGVGVPEAAAEKYLQNPEAIEAAKPLGKTTEEFLETVEQKGKDISGESGESFRDLLSSGKMAPKKLFSAPFKEAVENLQEQGVYGPERERAVKTLSGFIKNIEKGAGRKDQLLSLDKGKSIITQLDSVVRDISARPGADSQVVSSMMGVRKKLDDYLKQEVPAYADRMEQVAKDTEALKELGNRFRTPKGAQDLLNRIKKGKDQGADAALKAFDERFKTNYSTDLENSAVKEAFSKDTTAGSKKTLLGTVIGGTLGKVFGMGDVGAVAGAAAGYSADKIGGQIYQKLLKAGKEASPYIQALQDASQRGKLPFVHKLLLKNDPKYRQLLEKDDQ